MKEKLIRDGLAAVVPESRTCTDVVEFTEFLLKKYSEETKEFQFALSELSLCENDEEYIETCDEIFFEAADVLQVLVSICSKFTNVTEKEALNEINDRLEYKSDKLGTFKSQTIMINQEHTLH